MACLLDRDCSWIVSQLAWLAHEQCMPMPMCTPACPCPCARRPLPPVFVHMRCCGHRIIRRMLHPTSESCAQVSESMDLWCAGATLLEVVSMPGHVRQQL